MVTVKQKHVDAIDGLDVITQRVEALRKQYYDSEVHICAERSHLATESWKETEGQPLHIRRAKLFAKICDETPIAIFDHELIVGSQTAFLRGIGLQLDFNSRVGAEVGKGERRLRAEQAKGVISDKDLKTIVKDSLYWKGKSPAEIMSQAVREVMGYEYEHQAHTNYVPDADYAKVIRQGLRGIIAEIDEEIAALQFTSPEDGRKYQFLRAVKICCEAEIRLAKRYAELARQMAAGEADKERKKELETIAEVCEHVPENPARNFREGLQCARFIHLGLYLEDGNGAGASLGRIDQYLYPLYKSDLEQGGLARQQAAELLAAFWVKIATTERMPPVGEGYVQSRAILGGVDRDGNDASNELTHLILHVAGQTKLDVPMYLRWHSGASRELMLKAVWTNKQTGSEPAFHNDEHSIPGLVADGASLEDARNYMLCGCCHPHPYGSVYGTVCFMNGGKVLELVMNNGYDPQTGKQVGVETGDPRQFTSVDDWANAFMKQWEHMYDVLIKSFNIAELTQMEVYSQPFASALTPDCIKNGLDVHQGGSRYRQFIGGIMIKVYSDVPDALVAINQLVYKERKITVDELLEACANNFEGERGEYIRSILIAAPKFGNDSGEPEEIYRLLNDRTAAIGRSRKGYFGFPIRDSKYGGAMHLIHGRMVGALPNGRKALMPLSDGGISPCAGCDTRGPTVTLRSVARAVDFNTNRSAILNQKIPKTLLKTREQRNLFVDLIETYFADYNGYQVQWNIEDREVYLAAKANPKAYKDLIVRVGGFSAYFIELDPVLQDEIIARTEQTLGCCA
jgi:pyruvate formate-lyase/glycerol dehydratase family glycyl radical enzyme